MKTKHEISDERRREKLAFTTFLRDRVSALGTWPAPWPAVFWGAEIILAVGTPLLALFVYLLWYALGW